MKKIICLILLGMFFISLASAVDWDNYAKYEDNDMQVKIKDSYIVIDQVLNFGEELGTIKLTSHKSTNEVKNVIEGKDRIVMTYDFYDWVEYKNGIGNIEITNMKNKKKENKDYHLEEIVYEYYDVPVYEFDCKEDISINGSTYENCERIQVDTLKEKKIKERIPYNSKDIPNRNITLALVTDVIYGDYYDAVWEVAGIKLNKHAAWESSLNNGGLLYYQLNATSGTDVVEYWNGTYNSTSTGNHWVAGAVGNAYDPNADEDWDTGLNLNGGTELTLRYIARKASGDTLIDQMMYYDSDGGAKTAGQFDMYQGTLRFYGGTVTTNYIDDNWEEHVFTMNQSHINYWKNGSHVSATAFTGAWSFESNTLNIFSDHAGNQKFNGLTLDEISIWNRELTSTEISNIYDGGTFSTPTKAVSPSISITITNPTATTYTTNTHNLTYTFTNSSGNTDSCWYSLDLGATNSSRVDCGTNWTGLNSSEGSNTWTVYGNITDGTLGNDTITFTTDTINPNITIEYPAGIIEYSATGYEIELNFTATDTNLDSCWYEYDSSNTTVTCTSGTKVNTTFLLTNQNNMTIWANDSFGNLASNFTNWTANLQVNNLTYDNNVSETSRQTFNASFQILDTEITSAQLIYNNETYSISNLEFDGNTLTLFKSIDIPVNYNNFTEQTNNFSFRFNYAGSTFDTQKFYQNVTYINLQLCNATFATQALNFTLYDEIKQSNINPAQNNTNFESYFQYWIGGGDVKKNYAFQELLNSSDGSYQFCIYPYNSSTIFKTNNDIDYSATYFRENEYHLRNATLTNVSNNILLYLLSNDIATKFFLTFQQGAEIIEDATVTVEKYFTGLGSYQPVGILLTDDYGEATMWQEVDKQYRYSIVKGSSLLGIVERISSCSVAPCTKTILIPDETQNVFESYYDLYAINIVSNLSYNSSTKMVSYTFLDTTGLANYFRLVVKERQLNATGNTVCDSTSYSVVGTLTCNLSSYSNSEFVATTYISRSPEKEDKILGIIISEDIIDDLGLIGIFLVMAIIITIIFAGAVVTKGSPSGVLWFLGGGILVLKLTGLFPFTWITTTALLIVIIYLISKIKI